MLQNKLQNKYALNISVNPNQSRDTLHSISILSYVQVYLYVQSDWNNPFFLNNLFRIHKNAKR